MTKRAGEMLEANLMVAEFLGEKIPGENFYTIGFAKIPTSRAKSAREMGHPTEIVLRPSQLHGATDVAVEKNLFGAEVLPEAICTPIAASMMVLPVTVYPNVSAQPVIAVDEFTIVF